jgi:hypothetical protein
VLIGGTSLYTRLTFVPTGFWRQKCWLKQIKCIDENGLKNTKFFKCMCSITQWGQFATMNTKGGKMMKGGLNQFCAGTRKGTQPTSIFLESQRRVRVYGLGMRRVKPHSRAIPNTRGLGWDSSQVWPHIFRMLPTNVFLHDNFLPKRKRKKLKVQERSKVWRFSVTRNEGKKVGITRFIYLVFHCVIKHIEEWLKICILILIYSQIWLNFSYGWLSLFFYGWSPL